MSTSILSISFAFYLNGKLSITLMVSQDLKEISVEEADTAELLLLYSYLLKQGIKPIWPNIKETFDHFVPKYWFFQLVARYDRVLINPLNHSFSQGHLKFLLRKMDHLITNVGKREYKIVSMDRRYIDLLMMCLWWISILRETIKTA